MESSIKSKIVVGFKAGFVSFILSSIGYFSITITGWAIVCLMRLAENIQSILNHMGHTRGILDFGVNPVK